MATLRYLAFTEFVLYTSNTTWILVREACDGETGFLDHLFLMMLLCLPSNEPDRLQPLRFCHLLLRIAFTSKPGKRIGMGMQLFWPLPRIGFQEFSTEASDEAKEAQQRFKGGAASV